LGIFVYQFAQALAESYNSEPALLYLGAIRSEYGHIFTYAFAATALLAVVIVTAVTLWTGERRSRAGRVYFTALALAAIIVVYSLWRLGMLVLP
ncbi:MAG: hypothetical protein OES35_14175, partial [Chromatiales bacterium]|nr:hypothetical protein [Chromatiales bacterium]